MRGSSAEAKVSNVRTGPGLDPPLREASHRVAPPLLIRRDQLVHGGVDRMVDLFPGGIGVEPRQRLSNPFGETSRGAVARNKVFDLAVVKNHSHGLVPDQRPFLFGDARGDEIRWNVHQLRFHANGGADDAKWLIPGPRFFCTDVKRVPESL